MRQVIIHHRPRPAHLAPPEPELQELNNEEPPAQAAPTSEPSYEVGYGKPPKEHQFKKGQSGNAKGRPKGRKNFSTILDDVLYEPVVVNGRRGSRKMPALEAGLRCHLQNGLNGNVKAFEFLVKLMEKQARSTAQDDAPTMDRDLSATDRAILDMYTEEILAAAARDDEARGGGCPTYDDDLDCGEGEP